MGGSGLRPTGGSTRATRPQRSVRALIDAVFPEARPEADRDSAPAQREALLLQSLERLARISGCETAVAWGRDPGAEPFALAATGAAPAIASEQLEKLLALPEATDLGQPGLDAALCELARRLHLSAAVSVLAGEPGTGEADFVLALGSPSDPPGNVRPRSLAALAQAARDLRAPLASLRALGRLGRLDEEVRRLDRLAALGDLLAEVVHEVRNPLVSVKTFLQLLPERLEDPEFLGGFRQLVTEEVQRLERLLDEVLRHSRPGASASSDDGAELAGTFASVTHLVAHRARERGVRIDIALARGADRVAMGRDALRQVLLNLTLNALDATPVGGLVRLGADLDPAAGRLRLWVEDEGPGIAAADRDRIFEAFYSTRADRPGGLGLAISRRLVEECGGCVEVVDAPGGGARFVLHLAARA